MTVAVRKPATHADIEALPPNVVGKILFGSLVTHRRPHRRHGWYLDPRARTLEVFNLQEKNWLLTRTFVDREDVCAPPFEAVKFSLGLLWPFDPPQPETPADEQR